MKSNFHHPAFRSVVRLALPVMGVVLLVSACGSATADPGPTSKPPTLAAKAAPAGATSTGSVAADPQAVYSEFSECIRSNGFPDFEDLSIDAFSALPQDGSDQAQGAKVFREEMAKRGVDISVPANGILLSTCGPVLQSLRRDSSLASSNDTQRTQITEFAACVRSFGISDWPDPDFQLNGQLGYSLDQIRGQDFTLPEWQAVGRRCDPKGDVKTIFAGAA
jgi:hypothetical protein